MKYWVAVLIALALASVASAQTNIVYNPTSLQFDDPQPPCPNTTVPFCTQSYVMSYWLQNVDPDAGGLPVSQYTFLRSQVHASGLAAPLPLLEMKLSDISPLPAVPAGSMYVARLRTVTDAGATSPWSIQTNPFASAGAPLSPGNLRLR